jgi:LysM repeat protein
MKSMLVGLGMVTAAASLGLVSCAGPAASPSTTVIDVGATNFVTIPPVPVTPAPITVAPDAPGSVLEFESEYTLVDGDLPFTVAYKFKVDFQEFLDINGFTLDDNQFVPEWPSPAAGIKVKIPAGATVPGEPVPTVPTTAAPGTEVSSPTVTDAPTVTEETEPATTTTLSGECAPGSYVILEGDYPGKVAEKFDVSVGALNSANANTKYYSSFAVGVKIVIPAPSDC